MEDKDNNTSSAEAEPVKFSAKQFEWFAGAIRDLKARPSDKLTLAHFFATKLQDTNAKFDPARFIKAVAEAK